MQVKQEEKNEYLIDWLILEVHERLNKKGAQELKRLKLAKLKYYQCGLQVESIKKNHYYSVFIYIYIGREGDKDRQNVRKRDSERYKGKSVKLKTQ